MTISDIIDGLTKAEMQGKRLDIPEGAAYITVSATLLQEILDTLMEIEAWLKNAPETSDSR